MSALIFCIGFALGAAVVAVAIWLIDRETNLSPHDHQEILKAAKAVSQHPTTETLGKLKRAIAKEGL